MCLLMAACGPADVVDNGGSPWIFGNDTGMEKTCPEITGKLQGVDDETDLVVCGEPDEVINNRSDLSTYEGCEIIRSHVALAFFRDEDLPAFASLRKTEQQFVVRGTETLKSVHGLRRLEVADSFRLDYAMNLQSLEGLENLREVATGMALWHLPGVTTLEPLGNLTVTGGLSILHLPHLTSLDGLDNLCRIDGDLEIGQTSIMREDVEAFLDRVDVTGTVTFHGENLSR